jgi:zinc protease
VVESGIAAGANAWYSPIQLDIGTFGVSATPRPGKDVAALEAAVLGTVHRLLSDGVTEDEVAHAKTSMTAAAIYARDSLRSASTALGRALATGQTVDDVESWPDRIAAVTAADVNRVAKAFLVDTEAVTSVLLPKEGS